VELILEETFAVLLIPAVTWAEICALS